ncbi:MAG TPA: hypothetical protein VJV75_08610 [Candidatus Polarisedimenticolia bacterium]|nr:hypothetical protein [Candidatus Polarisedimenticolia bacterium]
MSKPILGLLLGAALGMLDGLSAFAYPGVATMMTSIIIGSTFKGLITGFATGYFATKLKSLPLGMLVGLLIGFALSYWVAANSPDPDGRYYYPQIILPGSAVGAIVGYACWRYGRAPVAKATA